MTEKQKRFADEYLIDLNATRAYKAAYPSVKKDETAKAAGSRMLTNVNVKKYIDGRMEEIRTEKTADAQEVLEYLTKGMRMELEEEVVVIEGSGDGCSEARKIKKQISIKDSNKCAELLGKRYRLFIDKIEADVNQVVVFGGEDDLED